MLPQPLPPPNPVPYAGLLIKLLVPLTFPATVFEKHCIVPDVIQCRDQFVFCEGCFGRQEQEALDVVQNAGGSVSRFALEPRCGETGPLRHMT